MKPRTKRRKAGAKKYPFGKKLALAVFFVIMIFGFSALLPVLAAPPTTVYYAGETLNPNCAPGSANCTVAAPITTIFAATTTVTMGNYDLNFDSGTLYIDAVNNRVGIGTTTPSEKLTVIGSGAFADGSTTSTLSKNSLIIAQAAGFNLGKFYVDSLGNVNASGTINALGFVTSTLDGVTIGGSTKAAGSFTTLSATGLITGSLATSTWYGSVNTTTLDGVIIGGSTAAAGTFSTLMANNLATLSSGFISSASSSVSRLQVSGILNASSSLLINGALTMNQTAGTFDLGKFYVDSSGNVNASGTIYGNVLSAPSITLNGDTRTSWPAGGGATGFWVTSTDSLLGYTSGMTAGYAIVIGGSATTTNSKLEIVGNAVVRGGNSFLVTDGTTTSTLSKNSLIIAQAAGFNLGKFYVDSLGNVNASGTINALGFVTSTLDGVTIGGSTAAAGTFSTLLANNLATLSSGFISSASSSVSRLQVSGILNASSSLLINGALTMNQTAGTFDLGKFYVDSSGNVNASGSLKVYGNVTSSGHIYPTTNNAVDLGAYGNAFRNIYASGTIFADGFLSMANSSLSVVSSTLSDLRLAADGSKNLQFWTNASQRMAIDSSGKVGIGTSTPNWTLQVAATRPFITLSDTNAGVDRKHWFMSSQGGNFYIGTSTDSLAATSTYFTIKDMGDISFGNDGLYYENTTTITYINSLETGNLNFDNDAGMVSWIDMDVTSVSASGTSHSYTAFMDGNPMLMIWGESDSAGYTSSTGISIATSTTSTYKLYIDGGASTSPAIGAVGYIKASGYVTQSSTLDLAETYPIDSTCFDNGNCPMPGDLVCATENTSTIFTVERCREAYSSSLVGIVSTEPGFILGDYDFGRGPYASTYRVVALSGRVPLRVSTANGPIKKGDYLTSSNVPGVAMRATEPGRVVGVALQDFGENQISDIGYQILDISVTEGTVLTFVNPHWSIGYMNIEEISNEMPVEFGILDRFTLAIKNALRKLGLIIQDGIAKVKSLHTDELCVGDTCVDEAKLKELLEKSNTSPSVPVVDPATVDISTTSI